MDPSLDDFINYDGEDCKRESALFDIDFLIDSPFYDKTDLFGNVPTYLPKTIQNLLEPEDDNKNNYIQLDSENFPNIEYHHFPTDKSTDNEYLEGSVKYEATESHYSPVSPQESDSNLAPSSKKITKRERAKEKAKQKQEALDSMIKQIDKRYIPEGFDDPNLDSKTRKKMIQVIRNRVSAQASRDKKKNLLQKLEGTQCEIAQINEELAKENSILKEKLMNIESERNILLKQIEALKRREPSFCSQCRSTREFGSEDNNLSTTEGSSVEMSNASSPLLYRATSRRGNLFGLGVTFTTLLCCFLFISLQSSPSSLLKTLFAKIDSLNDDKEAEETAQSTNENIKYDYEYKYLNSGFKDDDSEEGFFSNKLKWLMAQFDNHHTDIYKNYEADRKVLDLSSKDLSFPSKVTSSNSTKKPFLAKNTNNKIVKNQTSTLVFSNGYEVRRNESNPHSQTGNEQIDRECLSNDCMEPEEEFSDLKKADFIQLFIPRSAVGQLTAGKDNHGLSGYEYSDDCTDSDESSSLLEVWCKIYAVRDVSMNL